MMTKAVWAAGAGVTALLAAWAVTETMDGEGGGETGAELAERGRYDAGVEAPEPGEDAATGDTAETGADGAAAPRANGRDNGRDTASGAEDARSSEASRGLRSAHETVMEAGEPGEADWLETRIDGDDAPYPVWHHTILPGDSVELEADAPFALSLNGEIVSEAARSHTWTAPREPGNHVIRAFTADGETQQLTMFVVQPYAGETVLEGYRIGTYPENRPNGFIRLAQEDMDLKVSPSFKIGQFICKQQIGHWPKYILTSGDMLVRLELLLENLREDGRTDADTFFVMSGFRTPFYNTAIGSARKSRHMYGDAADIYPDVEGDDSVIDDLNRDGRITRADAEWLYDYAVRLYADSDDVVPGGIGAYGATAAHGPFVHIDGRGRAARWGRHGS
ncbi:MAG: D-Ala-D-Ala carboxypeptidase family metallohydrolase [Oceanicaulis sp.]